MFTRFTYFALLASVLTACRDVTMPDPGSPRPFLSLHSPAPTVIGFDDLAEGTLVTSQYAALGVTFSSTGPLGPRVECISAFGPPSLPNALTVGLWQGGCTAARSDGRYTFTFRFSPAVCAVSLVAMVREGTQSLVAFDANGTELARDTKVMFSGIKYAVAAEGIAFATFFKDGTDGGLTALIDDVTFTACPEIIDVVIDIKPGSDPNSINCSNEKEVIAVAILSTDEFDATTVDHGTVVFEGARETHVNRHTGSPTRHEEDVDGDGDIDLLLHFSLGETELTCDSREGTISGRTFEGAALQGTDAVRMVVGSGGQP